MKRLLPAFILIVFLLGTVAVHTPTHAASSPGPAFPVLLLHGWCSPLLRCDPVTYWSSFITYLKETLLWSVPDSDGDVLYTSFTALPDVPAADVYRVVFTDGINLGFDEQAAQLANAIDAVRRATGAEKVALVAHGMGGLAAREYMEFPDLYNSGGKVAALITIATPHDGADFSAFASLLGFTFDEARLEMAPDSSELQLLNLGVTELPHQAWFVSLIGIDPNPLAALEAGGPGDGVVTASSQDLNTILLRQGVTDLPHAASNIDVAEVCDFASFALPEAHTCETSNADVQATIVAALQVLRPQLTLTLNQPHFSAGDSLTLSLTSEMVTGGADLGDLYLAVEVPDGSILLFDGVKWSAAPAPFRSSFTLTDSALTVFSSQLPTPIPPGTYTFFGVLAKSGTNPYDSNNWLSNLAQMSFTFSAPPPPPSASVWFRRSSILADRGFPPDAPAGLGFSGGAYDSTRRAYYWKRPAGFYAYGLATDTWSHWDDGVVNPGPGAHNCTLAYDPLNDTVWVSGCAPQPTPGTYSWSPVTKIYTQLSTSQNACATDPVMVYVPTQQALYCVGGWSNVFNRVMKLPLVPKPTGALTWQTLFEGGPIGQVTVGPDTQATDFDRETNIRGGYDPARDALWVVTVAGEYWRWSISANTWAKVLTTGVTPRRATSFALDVAANKIIGFAGYDPQTGVTYQETYELDLVTNVWTYGPVGTAAPQGDNYYDHNAFYDPVAQHAIWMLWNGSMFGVDMWEYRVGTVSPPPPPPAATYPLTIPKAGTGTGTVTGAGSYAAGALVSITAVAASGSTFSGWSGPTGCPQTAVSPATVTMPAAALACTATFALVPVPGFPLTLSTTGTGTGQVSGGGTYQPGNTVTLTAVAASGSTFVGWSPASCGPTFVMPASALACTATFTLNPPPPPPGTFTPMPSPMPLKTFVPIPAYSVIDGSPWPLGGGSKHQRWAADGTGKVWTGFGDTNPSITPAAQSQNQGYTLNAATGAWARWNTPCRTAEQIMPEYPDELPWAYDQRGAFWLMPGILQGTDGAICFNGLEPSGATMYKTGLFRYDVATDRWSRFVTPNAATNALWAQFDNQTKSLMWWGMDATASCGNSFHKLNVDTLAVTTQPLCLSTVPYPGSGGVFENYARGDDASWAWDEAGRTAYFVTYHAEYISAGPTGITQIHAWKMNVDTGVITRLADPPNTLTPRSPAPPGTYANSDAQDILWDSKNKRVIYPYTPTHCGVLEGMYTYDPATNTWETHSLVPSVAVPGGKVRGNTAVYDPFNNVVVLGGSVACTDWGYPGLPNITHYFYWRYGN